MHRYATPLIYMMFMYYCVIYTSSTLKSLNANLNIKIIQSIKSTKQVKINLVIQQK